MRAGSVQAPMYFICNLDELKRKLVNVFRVHLGGPICPGPGSLGLQALIASSASEVFAVSL